MGYKIPQASRDYDTKRIVERPDGFYWHDEKESDKIFGPFPTLLEATRIWNTTRNPIMNLGKPWSRRRKRSEYPTGLILKPASLVKFHSVLKIDQ